MNKILITGAAGYIGAVLVRQLLEKGYKVRGLDNLTYYGESLLSVYNHSDFEFMKGDIRNEDDLEKGIEGVDAVVHLAAIVGDPACLKQQELAKTINWEATKKLFDLCSETYDIQRFIFASTCSNYGKMEGNGYVNENSPLRPVSLYAELKVKFEEYLLNASPANGMAATSLRFSTVYGLSPRIRFDLTVNDFMLEVTMGNELVVFGEQFWRPYCHVEDLARACVLALESDSAKVANNVFNVGDTEENYQKKMIVEEILKIVPDARIKYVHKDEDLRDYRVDFTKIQTELGYTITKTVPDGLREIHSILTDGLVSNPNSPNYRNI